MVLQKSALLLVGRNAYATNLYHDRLPICMTILSRSIRFRRYWSTHNIAMDIAPESESQAKRFRWSTRWNLANISHLRPLISRGSSHKKSHHGKSSTFQSTYNSQAASTSDFQSEVGEVFGEIGGELELPAKFGWRSSSFVCWGKLSEAFSTKSPRQISPSNFTTRFWVVAGPKVFHCQYYRVQNDYTHIFIVWEFVSRLHKTSATQGFLAGIILCNSAPSS